MYTIRRKLLTNMTANAKLIYFVIDDLLHIFVLKR